MKKDAGGFALYNRLEDKRVVWGITTAPTQHQYSSFLKMDSIGHDSRKVSTKGVKETCLP